LAKFITTTEINYLLEELIKNASERLILISPYLKFSDRIKELIEDKERLKIDVRIVYGKSELQSGEINWLNRLTYVRTSFCKNLHAKCYLNEVDCIVTSLNLYEFSQANNNEMGVLLTRRQDHEAFSEALKEAQRIVRISDEVPAEAEKSTPRGVEPDSTSTSGTETSCPGKVIKISTSKIAKIHKMKTVDLMEIFVAMGYLVKTETGHCLTEVGTLAGAELRKHSKFGDYFVWPENVTVNKCS